MASLLTIGGNRFYHIDNRLPCAINDVYDGIRTVQSIKDRHEHLLYSWPDDVRLSRYTINSHGVAIYSWTAPAVRCPEHVDWFISPSLSSTSTAFESRPTLLLRLCTLCRFRLALLTSLLLLSLCNIILALPLPHLLTLAYAFCSFIPLLLAL